MNRRSKLWLCRDGDLEDRSHYAFYVRSRRPPKRYAFDCWMSADRHACPEVVHRLGIHLRPGQGPVEVKLSVVRKRGAK